MGFEDYVSENEAVTISGVSPLTLNRFAEAGYLRIESDSDGLRLFSKREILDVFGIQEQVIDNTVAKLEREAFNIPFEEPKESPEIATPDEATSETELDVAPDHKEEDNKVVQFPSEEDREVADTIIPPASSTKPPLEQKSSVNENARAIEVLEQEVARLKNISNMQDRVLDMREAEIASLKEERNWLRTRIERLEEKGDRDQLLLLSETQILRQMIVQQHQKSSPLRSALEWIGIVDPKPAPTLPASTIELANK